MVLKKVHISELESHMGYWLRRISNCVSHSFQLKLESKEVTVAEWVILRLAYDLKDPAPSLLAERLGMTRGAVSKLIERLIEKALVKRVYSKKDRRFQVISLTDAGIALVPQLAALADENDAEYFSCLSLQKRETLMSLLKELASYHQLVTIPIN
jgi:MarR family transcriptional regulator, lower aerobic nicotinate degradation pathway regulator